MMTRNDFELLARHLKAMYPPEKSDYRDGYNTAINQVAGACSAAHARFDVDRFKHACGAPDDKPVDTRGPKIDW